MADTSLQEQGMTTLNGGILKDDGMKNACVDCFEPNGENRCKDFDEDCFGLDHLHCWLYDPTQGICPFLETHSPNKKPQPTE
jgi:hypothetical protein